MIPKRKNLSEKAPKNLYISKKSSNFASQNQKKGNKIMSTFTLQIPTAQAGWFEQMVQSMGWVFSKSETTEAVSASEKRTRKAIEELESGKGTVCQSFEDYLKAVA